MRSSPGPACPVCRSSDSRPLLLKDDAAIYRCDACGLQFHPMAGMPPGDDARYEQRYFTGGPPGYLDYVGDEALHRFQARRYLGRLARAGAAGGRLLDVGSAAGFFLDEARRQGWHVDGCDVSAYATAHARGALGLDVQHCDFLTCEYPPASFDVITLFNVLEHLPEPRRVAARLTHLLRPGGVLFVETWNCESLVARLLGARWHQYSPRYVPVYYNHRSLRRLFPRELWSEPTFARSAKWISLERGLAIVTDAAEHPALKRVLAAVGRTRLGRVILPYGLGDLMTMVVRRGTRPRPPSRMGRAQHRLEPVTGGAGGWR